MRQTIWGRGRRGAMARIPRELFLTARRRLLCREARHPRISPPAHHVMTLRSKLAVGLTAIAVILVVPLVMAVQSLSGLHENLRGMQERELEASLLLGRLRSGLDELQN